MIFVSYNNYALTKGNDWKSLAPGFGYQIITPYNTFLRGRLYAFKIDLRYYQLELVLTHNRRPFFNSIENLVISHDAVLGINGGFFSPDLKPLGLRYSQGQLINPIKKISWWCIFMVKGRYARIIKPTQISQMKGVDFAIQAGPRLVVNGQIPKLRAGNANRSALGITPRGEIIIVATENLPISTTKLALIMRDELNCRFAINLDGGHSTQLFSRIDNHIFKIPSLTPVTDAILVIPKKS
ncbi:MAG: phosphodiester glycosidase family protein [Pseudomonadota bacterium]